MANVTIDIDLVTKAFNQALKESSAQVKGFQTQFEKTEKGVNTSFKKISKSAQGAKKDFTILNGAISSFLGNLAANVVTGFVNSLISAARGFKELAIESAKAAIDAEETRSKFTAVFSGISEEAEKTADTLAKSFGLGSVESRRLLSATGDLLTGFGFSQEAALDLATQVQELSVDLASFTNFSGGAEGASQALTKALLGERESVKSLGISIQEKDVQEQVALNRAKGLTFETERQAKAQATLEIAIRQSQNAIGDYARTSDSAANQSRLFETRVQDLKEVFGTALIPTIQEVFKELNLFLEQLDTEQLQRFAQSGLGAIAQGVSIAVSAFNIFRAAITAVDLGVKSLFVIFEAFKIGVLATAESVLLFSQSLRSIISSDPSPTLDNALKRISDMRKESELTAESLINDIDDTMTAREKEGKALDAFSEKFTSIANKEIDVEKAKNQVILDEKAKRAAKEAELETARQNQLKTINAAFEEESAVVKAELDIALEEDEITKIEKVRENEFRKIEIIKQAELEKAKTLSTASEKEIATLEATNKSKLARQRAINKAKEDIDKTSQKNQLQNQQAFFSAATSLAQSENKTLAAIGKAAAITQIAIKTPSAVASSFEFGSKFGGPPLGFAFAAIAATAMAAQATKVAGVGNFEQGGIVPGTSFAGDNLTANVNSGELILNRGQQQRLLNIANGSERPSSSGVSSGDIEEIVRATVQNLQVTLEANDVEIARSVSRGVDQGIVIGSN